MEPPAQLSGDGPLGVALGHQVVHQRVVATSAFGESTDGPFLIKLWLQARQRLARLGLDRTQAAAMVGHAALHRLAQVLPQVKPGSSGTGWGRAANPTPHPEGDEDLQFLGRRRPRQGQP